VAQQEKKRLLKDIPLLDFVIGTDNIDQLPDVLRKLRTDDERVVEAWFDHKTAYEIETKVRNPGVSTFVNITKGCDNFCTFCVVPFTRGRERSRPLKELIVDLNALVDRGVKEVTLLGQNVNSYKSSCGTDFAGLLKSLAVETGIERIRYITSHPKDFNEELMHVMADHNDKICEYIHLPVQSGSTKVLDRMNRIYTREEYIQKVKMIFDILPQTVLSTDIIVGFPGETDEQFEDTMSLLDVVPFESIYAFKYSPRPYTKAAKFTDHIDEAVKSERLQRLFAKHNIMAREMATKYEGQVLKVLVEEVKSDLKAFGRSTQNKVVYFAGEENLVGKTVNVKINTGFPMTLRGEWVK